MTKNLYTYGLSVENESHFLNEVKLRAENNWSDNIPLHLRVGYAIQDIAKDFFENAMTDSLIKNLIKEMEVKA